LEVLAASFFRNGHCEKIMELNRNREENQCLEELIVSSFMHNPEEESIHLNQNEITGVSEELPVFFREGGVPCYTLVRNGDRIQIANFNSSL
jgi:hypothetical protein